MLVSIVSKRNVAPVCVTLLVLCVGSSAQVRTPDQMLINPDPTDWVTYGGLYSSQRYSQLKQVTTANASRLQAKWVYHFDGADEGEVTPIVVNGVMYISGFNRVDAEPGSRILNGRGREVKGTISIAKPLEVGKSDRRWCWGIEWIWGVPTRRRST